MLDLEMSHGRVCRKCYDIVFRKLDNQPSTCIFYFYRMTAILIDYELLRPPFLIKEENYPHVSKMLSYIEQWPYRSR